MAVTRAARPAPGARPGGNWLGGRVGRRAGLPALALVLWLTAPGPGAAQGAAPPLPDPVPVADAYLAAWNAHDLPAVLARLAPDAVVRERRGPVPAAVWDARDPAVVRAYLDEVSRGSDDGHLVWVTGHQEIAAWAAARFAERHRYAVGPARATGETVRWSYREFVDPFQLMPGVGPSEGDAEAVVRGGRIAVLSLVQSPDSVRRQWNEGMVAVARAAATRRAAPAGAGPSVRRSGPPRGAAEPTGAAWPLGLSGLALLAGAVALRRRRGGNGGAERNRTTPSGPM